MKKAIRLSATLWVEGEAEPAANFAQIATRAVREMLKAGRDAAPEVTVTVKRIAEVTEEDETDTDDE